MDDLNLNRINPNEFLRRVSHATDLVIDVFFVVHGNNPLIDNVPIVNDGAAGVNDAVAAENPDVNEPMMALDHPLPGGFVEQLMFE